MSPLNERKIARAAEVCLTLMDDCDAPLVAEVEYISQLQSDDRWTDEEIRAVQAWVRAARSSESKPAGNC